MKIALVQFDPFWESKKENQKILMELLENSLGKLGESCSLIVFPEMTLTGFTMKSHQFAEEISGETNKYFGRIARKYNTNVLGGMIEKNGTDVFNSLVHLDNQGEIVSIYRKIHPFAYSGEDKNYKRGDRTVITKIENWKVGLSICYDLRFPELFRQYAKERVDLIVIIANWPVTRIAHWRALLKARAIENQCFIAGVNRIGNDPANVYNGFTSLYDPSGEELLSIENEEGVFIYDIDLCETARLREKLPFLNDMILL